MKITTRNGHIIEIADGETIPAELMSLIMGGEPMTSTATVAPVTMAPPPPPTAVDTTPPFLPLEGLRNMTPTAPRRRGPSKCYLSAKEHEVMGVLLEHPNGITSEDVAILLGVTRSAASSTLNRIRVLRPHEKGPTDLLVRRIPGHLYRITELGLELTYGVASPRMTPKRNWDAGWGR